MFPEDILTLYETGQVEDPTEEERQAKEDRLESAVDDFQQGK